ncbi:hypothetical protein HGRIS_012461 [Hohenbuehelia grisea]|uniref:FAD-binding PCMH-type domain-containing protein n=1 Tax=Hohenbuehelia grisea TaxID=104357 RepID=A0ABR3ISB6_9AGAR
MPVSCLSRMILQSVLLASLALAQPRCKCTFGKTCWPGEKAFNKLASQVSQPLVHPVPPESACYPANNPADNCTDVTAHSREGNWRAEFPGSMQTPYWETYTFPNGTISACYLDTTLGFSCQQGSVPVIGVDARSEKDVQTAVKFAAKNNLRLVVKNTGHDYLGRSTARGAFLIWTHHLKNITFRDTFRPVGAPQAKVYEAVMTLGSGVQWHEAYDAANSRGRLLVGGLSAGASVGAAGGWILGGGHSALSPHYGLGVDNVLEFSVVTADGRLVTANAYSHSDLFWALRGGGGGTFGVVTSVTYRTYPSVPVIGIFGAVPLTSEAIAKALVTEFIRLQPIWVNTGYGGYSNINSSALQFFFVAPNASQADVDATVQPFFDLAANLTSGGPPMQNGTVPFDSFFSWYRLLFSGGEQVGTNIFIGSRLLPLPLIQSSPEKVAETILSIEGGVLWHAVAGGAVSRVPPDSTGLNPAWRNAVTHVGAFQGWPEGASASVIAAHGNKLQGEVSKLEKLAPGSGAYFNEALPFEPRPQTTFFGSHYKRLKAIKKTYDPASLFLVANGVGSEDWDSSLNCRH